MIEIILSGGQTGADRAALDAAIACGVPHGGWCPKGRTAEDGPLPERYQLTETAGASYLARTEKNVKVADGTLIFTMGSLSGGSARTGDFARRHRKPWRHIPLEEIGDDEAAGLAKEFVARHAIRRLNVAGSSASKEPAIYERVLGIVTRLLSTRV